MQDFPLTADAYIGEGWRIFPVVPGGKTPAVDGWQTFNPMGYHFNGHNLGLPTGAENGIVVVDVDPKNGGWESLAELEKQYGKLPDTLRSNTANGGAHFFFRHPGGFVGNGAGIYDKPGVDVRGDGGYVVVPPSILDSDKKYAWDIGAPTEIAPLPEWIAKHKENRPRRAAGVPDAPFPEGTRNDALARIAGSLRHFGTPQDVLTRTLLDINDAKCRPPLPEAEVIRIAENIAKYKQGYAPKVSAPATSLSVPASQFVSMDVKPTTWLVQSIWPEGTMGFIAGMGKSFKSFLSLELGYSVASGADFLEKFKVPEQRRVLLVQQESGFGAYQVRVSNVAKRFGPTDNLYIVSNKHLSLVREEDIEKLENEIARVRPAMLILDPLASFLLGQDENSAQHMGEVVGTLRRLRDDYGCAICIVHHNRKDGSAMRGSTALYNASEVTIRMQRTADREALTSEVNIELKEFEGPMPFTVVLDSETGKLTMRNEPKGLPLEEFEAFWNEQGDSRERD